MFTHKDGRPQCVIVRGGDETCPTCTFTRTDPEPNRDGKCNGLKKDAIHRCAWTAGQGTEHLGIGRCKNHRGNQPTGPANHNYKTGLYSKVKFANLGEIANNLQLEGDPFDLRSEIAMLRSIAAYVMNKGAMGEATEILLKITKAVEKLDVMERGRRLVIDSSEVQAAIEKIITIIQKHVKDKQTLEAISRDISMLDLSTKEKAAQKEVEWIVKDSSVGPV